MSERNADAVGASSKMERLKAIRARCEELLAIASKRTPGKWTRGMRDATQVFQSYDCIIADCYHNGERRKALDNSTFITACAGSAEAGWKATIAAIDWLLSSPEHLWLRPRKRFAESIIAAWSEEML